MRFLLFNIVVIGALFYLFTSNQADVRSVADNAHVAADRAAQVATDAVDRINALMQRRDARESATPAVEEQVAALPSEPAVAAPEALTPKITAPAPKAKAPTSQPESLLSGDGTVPPPPAAPATGSDKGDDRPVVPRTRVAEPVPPAQFVPERPAPVVDPAATERLLVAEKAKPAATPAPSAGTDIAIADGEKLMSPRERRRELSLMAEDMELLYLKTVGK